MKSKLPNLRTEAHKDLSKCLFVSSRFGAKAVSRAIGQDIRNIQQQRFVARNHLGLNWVAFECYGNVGRLSPFSSPCNLARIRIDPKAHTGNARVPFKASEDGTVRKSNQLLWTSGDSGMPTNKQHFFRKVASVNVPDSKRSPSNSRNNVSHLPAEGENIFWP